MKHLIFTMSLLALVSCKDNKKEENKTEMNTVEHHAESEKEHHDDHDDAASNVYKNAWTSEIQMNNGAKWQADAKTNEGVQKMKNTIKTQTTSTLDEYYILAEQLNSDKNFVIKNCSMKGASHDNLHVWLLPLMAKIEALSETKTVEDATKIKHSIEENINEYATYFQ